MSARTLVSGLSLRSLKLNNTNKVYTSLFKCTSQSPLLTDSTRRISRSSVPMALSSLLSMMPLHSQIAEARLNSILSVESQSWGIIPLGISMPL